MNQLIQIFEQQIDILSQLNLKTEQSRTLAVRNQIDASQTRILITGEYSRGKSTLINSLIGSEFLTSSLLRLSTRNHLSYSPELTITVVKEGEAKIVNPEEPSSWEDSPFVKVEHPSSWLKGIELIEYPSISEAPDLQDLESELKQADLVVFVLAADSLYSRVEEQAFEQFLKPNGHRTPLFVINFVDRLRPHQLAEIKQMAGIRLPVNPDRIFFLSGMAALENEPNYQEAVDNFKETLIQESLIVEQHRRNRLKSILLANIELALYEVQKESQNSEKEKERHQHLAAELNSSLKQIKKIDLRIQKDFIEMKSSTKEVIRMKLSNLNKELQLQIDQWRNNLGKEDPRQFFEDKISNAVLQFFQEDFGSYLLERIESQEEQIKISLSQYQSEIGNLYKLLAKDPPSITLDLSDFELDTSRLSEDQFVPENGANRFDPSKKVLELKDLLRSPEALFTLVGTAIGGVFLSQFALIIIPAGLATSAFLTYIRSQSHNKKALKLDIEAIKTHIQEQLQKFERESIDQFKEKMQKLEDGTIGFIKTASQEAQKDVLEAIQVNHKSSSQDYKGKLESMRDELSSS